ncbi:MAG: hypothetical protein J4G18_11140 [Anaerolineae bacterium]|nr:hypothetical protein [Anaerolineae bacterium]
MRLHDIINQSYRDAARALVMGTSPQARVRSRERVFIKARAKGLGAVYADEGARVFS